MKPKKITRMMILVSLGLALALYPTTSVAKEKYEEKFEKTVPLAKDGKVFLGNVSGDIEVKTWKEEQVKIDALKIAEASTLSRAQEDSKKVTIEVNKEGNVLRIETKYPDHKGIWGHESLNVSVYYKIWIPDKADLEIKSVSGDVMAEGAGALVGVNVVSGDVEVRGAGQGADCNTVSGELKLEDIAGDVDLKSVSGTITINRVSGSVDAETVSGDIEIREASDAKSLKLKTLSGDIIYQGKVNPNGRYNLKSHSGDIDIILPSDSAFEFEAETFSGDIKSDFELAVSGKISPREVRGVVNKGGAFISVSTFSGNIDLKKV